ncbi:ArgR family transcriptional regulator [Thalassotalea sp. SU-HH00458]|uniref:ArgR family transcriptional regulator n=1 Tax=Thalassotalea sp. SU-HH00458 TaxID=3127657 RepID=UPI00310A71AD
MIVTEPELICTLKSLIRRKVFGSQSQLVKALSLHGFENVTQTRVSRLLHKIGAIKIRNHRNDVIYTLPEKQQVPTGQQAIDSVILDIKHNNMHIIIKTVIGAAILISKMIENLGEQAGILGCMSSDNTILIIPTEIDQIQQITNTIIEYLDVNL